MSIMALRSFVLHDCELGVARGGKVWYDTNIVSSRPLGAEFYKF